MGNGGECAAHYLGGTGCDGNLISGPGKCVLDGTKFPRLGIGHTHFKSGGVGLGLLGLLG